MRQSYIDYFSDHIHHIDRNNNMGLVRYVLAFGVLIAHFNFLCGANVPWIISSYFSVGGFFALSGFVLIGSLLRGASFKDYVIRRAWRILPSYFFIVIVAAILLVIISDWGIKEYFGSSYFWKYLGANLSFMNFIHPGLPGVFEGTQHADNAVNGSLWTMKLEWQLSLSAPLFVWACISYKLNIRKAIVIVIGLSLLYRAGLEYLYDRTQREIYAILARQLFGQMVFFYGGIFIFTFYNKVAANRTMFIITSAIIYISSLALISDSDIYNIYIQPLLMVVLVVSLSMIPNNVADKIDKGHNISYEIYLCHYPVLQLVAAYGLVDKIGVPYSLIIAIAGTIALSILTYICVGRLYLKRAKSTHTLSSPSSVK